jgi:hypothetical protein
LGDLSKVMMDKGIPGLGCASHLGLKCVRICQWIQYKGITIMKSILSEINRNIQ